MRREQPPCRRRITQSSKESTNSGLTVAQFGLMTNRLRPLTTPEHAGGAIGAQPIFPRNLHALERDGLVEIAIVERDPEKASGLAHREGEHDASKRRCQSGDWPTRLNQNLPGSWRIASEALAGS